MSESAWVRLCSQSDLLPGETRVAWLGDTPVLLLNIDGAVYALEDRCSHQDFELSAGEFDAEAGTIECTLHAAKFNVRDGRALCPPASAPVRKFPIKIEDGAVWSHDERA
ncbi:MAG: Rieske (2Fe-2S) protein [Pseudomarimonas sp.]